MAIKKGIGLKDKIEITRNHIVDRGNEESMGERQENNL